MDILKQNEQLQFGRFERSLGHSFVSLLYNGITCYDRHQSQSSTKIMSFKLFDIEYPSFLYNVQVIVSFYANDRLRISHDF
jgi:hypothetical protein